MTAAGRVVLRAPTAADRDEFLAVMRRSRSLHRPFLTLPTTTDAFDAMLERARHESYLPMLARRRDDDAIVGYLAVSNVIRGSFQSAFIGYGGVAGQTGQGYMTEALEGMLRRAFADLRLHRLEANIRTGEQGVDRARTPLRLRARGFSPRYLKVGGRWCDHERWAIRVERWRARRDRPREVAIRREQGSAGSRAQGPAHGLNELAHGVEREVREAQRDGRT